MADCNSLFKQFHETIQLSPSKKDNLKISRNANRTRIEKHFIDKGWAKPTFTMQGSYKLGTLINPITTDDEYDLDDGVYLQNLDNDKSKWKNPSTVHQWIVDAVKGVTSSPPNDKNKCVRANYNTSNPKYHIDFPIYCKYNGTPHLAIKKDEQWVISDSTALKEWILKIITENDDQPRRLIKYLKAWKDNQSWDSSVKAPTGLLITILVCEYYVHAEKRDDLSLLSTLDNIIDFLESEDKLTNPVYEDEDFLDSYSKDAIEKMISKLEKLKEKGEKALSEKNYKKASEHWRKPFGDRFPLGDDKNEDEKAKKTKKEANIYETDNRSA